jgi:hypothetical protein
VSASTFVTSNRVRRAGTTASIARVRLQGPPTVHVPSNPAEAATVDAFANHGTVIPKPRAENITASAPAHGASDRLGEASA